MYACVYTDVHKVTRPGRTGTVSRRRFRTISFSSSYIYIYTCVRIDLLIGRDREIRNEFIHDFSHELYLPSWIRPCVYDDNALLFVYLLLLSEYGTRAEDLTDGFFERKKRPSPVFVYRCNVGSRPDNWPIFSGPFIRIGSTVGNGALQTASNV